MTDREGGNTEASRPNVIPYSDTNNTDTMNTKIVWIVVAILLLGAAFWFVTDYQKEGADDQQLSEGSTATDPNSVHNAGIRDPMRGGTGKSRKMRNLRVSLKRTELSPTSTREMWRRRLSAHGRWLIRTPR